MADYATVAQIKGLGIQTDAPATATTVWDDLATAASRMFDSLVEVSSDYFAAAPDPESYTVRDFYGNGTGYLSLDPYTELNPVNPIVIDPANAYDVPEYVEREGMLVVSGSFTDRLTGWDDGVKVTVSANWGFPAIPKDVQIAVAKIALYQWRISDPVNADNVNATAEPLIDGIPASVWATVEKYREKYSQRCLFA